MKLKHLLLISAVAMSFAACDDDDDVKKTTMKHQVKSCFPPQLPIPTEVAEAAIF